MPEKYLQFSLQTNQLGYFASTVLFTRIYIKQKKAVFLQTKFAEIPVPGNTPVTVKPIQIPPIVPPAVSTTSVAAPDPIPSNKGGSGFGWFLFGLLILGTIGATIYMSKKDSAPIKSTEN